MANRGAARFIKPDALMSSIAYSAHWIADKLAMSILAEVICEMLSPRCGVATLIVSLLRPSTHIDSTSLVRMDRLVYRLDFLHAYHVCR
eukprot:6191718-Pleurochrysis_carterae.AAC.4